MTCYLFSKKLCFPLMVIEYKRRGNRSRKTYISLKKPAFEHGMLFFDKVGIIIIQVSRGFYLKVRKCVVTDSGSIASYIKVFRLAKQLFGILNFLFEKFLVWLDVWQCNFYYLLEKNMRKNVEWLNWNMQARGRSDTTSAFNKQAPGDKLE